MSVHPKQLRSQTTYPLNSDVTGTTETHVGSIYLDTGTVSLFAMIGAQSPSDAGSLVIRRYTDASSLTTIGGVASGLIERSQTGVSVSNADWYDCYLKGDSASAVAQIRGLKVSYTA